MNLFRKKEEVLTFYPKHSKKQKKRAKAARSDELPLDEEVLPEEDQYVDILLPDEPEQLITPERKTASTAKKKKTAKPAFYRSKLVIGSACVIAACLISFVLVPVMSYVTSTEMTTVIKAAAAIPKGTRLDAAMLQTVSVPALNVGGALREAAPAVGKYAAVDIVAGDTLMQDKLSEIMPFPDDYLHSIPAGRQAISATIQSFAGGLSGKLTAGDIVSIYAVLPKTGEDDDYHAILPPELAYVQVLSVTSKLGIDRKESGADQAQAMDEENQPVTVTLLVNVRQAAALAGLNSGAQVHMALVSRGNAAAAQQYLQLQEDYFLAEDEPEDMESEAADLQITEPQDTPDTESEAETIE